MKGTIEGSLTINEVTRLHPSTLRMFKAFGIDTCCGGTMSLVQAAHVAGITLDSLLHAIDALTVMSPKNVSLPAAGSCCSDCRGAA